MTTTKTAHAPDLAPSKIIAVHINYPSRAAQRGRTPGQPSYFLKPPSSLSRDGDPIERPAGCELLAFEGEIALIIGTRTRLVAPKDGWAAVAAVTASNDLGVYDLRYADKGSNLRSKGADGFTPVGPRLIPAAAVDPAALRIRTWVNGRLVQEDSTATLLFPFGRLVADLSQLITLEAGDIILTGTPAGASVLEPGDVVEVEVDAPDAAGSVSSGRLRNTVVEGSIPLAEYGAQPKVDDVQRAEAYGTPLPGQPVIAQPVAGQPVAGQPVAEQPVAGQPVAEQPVAGQPVAELAEAAAPSLRQSSAQAATLRDGGGAASSGQASATAAFVLTDELITRINSVGTATLSSQLRKRGINNATIDGLASTRPTARLVGRARTLRYLPNREDLFQARGGGYNVQKQVFDALGPGDVLVMDARRDSSTGTVGDILALRAQVRGAVGIVTDGGIRDLEAVSALDIPTYHAGAHPAVLGRKHVPWDFDTTIACGGTTVQPGDIIIGDADGIIVMPPALVEEVVTAAIEQEREERFIAEQVAAGERIDGLYPMNQEWKARYREWADS